MHKKRNIFGNKLVTFSAFALVIFGSLMIASAEMGNSVGDEKYLTDVITKQAIYAFAGVILYFICMYIKLYKRNTYFFYGLYIILVCSLISCRFFSPVNGAYAWIRFGGFTVQPSEFAKVFMIIFGAKLLGEDHHERNFNNFVIFAVASLICVFIIFVIQNDLGSSIVLLVICFCIGFIPPYKELKKIHKVMRILVFVGIGGVIFMLLPPVNDFLKNFSGSYKIARFLAAADPFLYRYDNGYHVIMSLVSFANGGLFGLGYGNSIHKYMNFPNPSNDFILPVIVEELGIIGFIGFVAGHCCLLIPLVRESIKSENIGSKMIYFGVFTYFIVHFILNVGGVSAFIPLTGVPLLLISSGGSSLVASLMGLGFAQCEMLKVKESE